MSLDRINDGRIKVSNELSKLNTINAIIYELNHRKNASLFEIQEKMEDCLIDYNDHLHLNEKKYSAGILEQLYYRLVLFLVTTYVDTTELDILIKTSDQYEKNALDRLKDIISNEKKADTLENKKEVAFANLIMGYIECDNTNFDKAESCFRSVLEFYKTNDTKDERYIRLKNSLAQVVDKQVGRDKDAGKIYEEVSEYWSKLDCNRNLCAANHFIAYAKHKLQNGLFTEATESVQKAISIYSLTKDNKQIDNFIFTGLPWLAKEIYSKLSRHEQDKNTVLKIYILKLRESERYPYYFWKTKKAMAADLTIAAIGGACVYLTM